jgi:hypothetical protein
MTEPSAGAAHRLRVERPGWQGRRLAARPAVTTGGGRAGAVGRRPGRWRGSAAPPRGRTVRPEICASHGQPLQRLLRVRRRHGGRRVRWHAGQRRTSTVRRRLHDRLPPCATSPRPAWQRRSPVALGSPVGRPRVVRPWSPPRLSRQGKASGVMAVTGTRKPDRGQRRPDTVGQPQPASLRITPDDVAYLVATAARAPSVHNSQPWEFRVRGSALELYADLGHRAGTSGNATRRRAGHRLLDCERIARDLHDLVVRLHATAMSLQGAMPLRPATRWAGPWTRWTRA